MYMLLHIGCTTYVESIYMFKSYIIYYYMQVRMYILLLAGCKLYDEHV